MFNCESGVTMQEEFTDGESNGLFRGKSFGCAQTGCSVISRYLIKIEDERN